MLDEYWYYSLLTFVMLIIFESTLVKKRITNIKKLREMLPSSSSKYRVYRNGQWQKISRSDMVVGDICEMKMKRKKNEKKRDTISPCDMILLSGNCVINESILTGESTPQRKESLRTRNPDDVFDRKKDRLSIIFSGTKFIQSVCEEGTNKAITGSNQEVKGTSNQSILGYVVKTGFNSSQGKLMKMVFYNSKQMTANSKESLLFILFLLLFAILASFYVLVEGLKDLTRSRYKLFLNCVMIITSVVPPELPIQLSLAVQNSLIELQKLSVFCTEPFRIPFAGKITSCCFDKTGTLTSDQLILEGLILPNAPKEIVSNLNIIEKSKEAQYVIGGCHNLITFDSKLQGDPLEVTSLESTNWSTNGEFSSNKSRKISITMAKRFHFTSFLKRMTTIAKVSTSPENEAYVLTKGAAETIFNHLDAEKRPSNYKTTYESWSMKGYRVISLAYKTITFKSLNELKDLSREEAEKDLIFAGFLIFSCPIKKSSLPTLQELSSSSHKNVMITGDNELTAIQVAKQLEILPFKNVLLLKPNSFENNDTWKWEDLGGSTKQNCYDSKEKDKIKKLCEDYGLCVTGEGLQYLYINKLLPLYVSHIRVFARCSPLHKEIVLSTLKENGDFCLMCGDGTNDVGALKQSHVGVALLNNPDEDLIINEETNVHPEAIIHVSSTSTPSVKKRSTTKPSKKVKKNPTELLAKKINDFKNSFASDEEVPLIQMGASFAAPFTTKTNHIQPIIDLVRQGRCTLVTTTQMFKILALQCLVTAYSLSVLFLDGVKFGDTQMTVNGIFIALSFLFISRAKPLPHLSKEKPPSSLFNPYMFFSLFGQFTIHLLSMIFVVKHAKMFDNVKLPVEEVFKPNVLNTSLFLLTNVMQISTFITNYQGHPWMQSLRENKPLFYFLTSSGVMTVLVALGILPMDSMFELAPLNPNLRGKLVIVLFLDFTLSYLWEFISKKLFKWTG
eukprot:TRINITY_DN13747_c0_g1_i2.p1 TRINITY_DN13747_c0_g1~~TRINITY_DN13747_c0_g1_i2.p1  ORF type:complete len:958 (+),score=285.67 TRINITY_DN13747_c0_g1_i2:626-3499(+)